MRKLMPTKKRASATLLAIIASSSTTEGFTCTPLDIRDSAYNSLHYNRQRLDLQLSKCDVEEAVHKATAFIATATLSASLALGASIPAFAENELSDKYGGRGFDSSLVDQTCLVDKCSLQAKNCLQDDVDCRKGLTCTAKW